MAYFKHNEPDPQFPYPETETQEEEYDDGFDQLQEEDEEYVPEKAVSGLQGWVDCFEKAEFAGSLFCGGISGPGEASGKNEEQDEAYEFGKTLK